MERRRRKSVGQLGRAGVVSLRKGLRHQAMGSGDSLQTKPWPNNRRTATTHLGNVHGAIAQTGKRARRAQARPRQHGRLHLAELGEVSWVGLTRQFAANVGVWADEVAGFKASRESQRKVQGQVSQNRDS